MDENNFGFARARLHLYPTRLEYEVWKGQYNDFPHNCSPVLKNEIFDLENLEQFLFGLAPNVQKAVRLAIGSATLCTDTWRIQFFELPNYNLLNVLAELTHACCESQIDGNPYCLVPVKKALMAIKEATGYAGSYLDAVSAQKDKLGITETKK